MNNKKLLIITLVISILISSTMFSGTALKTKKTTVESLEVVKEVFDGADWVDEIDANMGEVINFRITITYNNITDPGHPHYAENIVVRDLLPPCLDYDEGSALPFEPTVGSALNELVWNVPGTLNDGESFIITFNATVIDYGENVNTAIANADEHCTGKEIDGEDTATVNVNYPDPEIELEKYVWDGSCFWVDEISAYPDEIVTFKIVVENTGSCDLYDLWINDTLSESLEYVVDTSIPFEPIIDGQNLSWYFNMIEIGETIEIIFNATVIGLPCHVDINWAYVEAKGPCGIPVTDQDSAKVHVNGMCMEKEVWDEELESWMESIEAAVGDTVRFRIKVYYYGPKTLYNIKVRDELPECFEYANNAIPEEPDVCGNILYWNLSNSYDLHDGEVLTIEFDAEVAGGLCDECINWAYVEADECSGRTFTWQDSATVYVECEFTANAGGPYYGDVDEEIEIIGTAADGNPPYIFEWDLLDDEEEIYDDATGSEITYSWDEGGEYIILLRVTDDDGDMAYDYAAVIITPEENNPPNKPDAPTGEASGRFLTDYIYTTSTTDPDGDQIMYLFDWGDGSTSGWLGPFDSGEDCTATNSWGWGSYNIRVKARDTNFEESDWSDPLAISMPKTKSFRHPIFIEIIYKLIERFPFIAKIFTI